MLVRGVSNQSAAYSANRNNKSNQSFTGLPAGTLDWAKRQLEISSNGSLTRPMFFLISMIFLVGARFIESRGDNERREVLTRDIPAVTLSCAGAPLLNNAVAYGISKKSGIPIVQLSQKAAESGNGWLASLKKSFKSFANAGFVSQKQVQDWYTNLNTIDNPLIQTAETVSKHGGNIKKVMKKFGLENMLNTITAETENSKILTALKDAQAKGSTAFQALEDALKAVPANNKVASFAKGAQASVKVGCILLTAALLGFFLPHLNIITTAKRMKKKHAQQEQGAENAAAQQQTQTQNGQSQQPVQVQAGGSPCKVSKVVSFHKTSAIQTYKSFLK